MKIKLVIGITLFFLSACLRASTLPLDSILTKTMNAAEKYNELIESYQAELYTRTYVETLKKNILYKYTHLIPRFILHDPSSKEVLIETFGTLKYDFPNNYIHNIKYVTGTMTRKRDLEMIPFNFFNINVYGENTNDESFFMPLRVTTRKYYTYRLVRSHSENDKTYYTIDFTPVFNNQKLLKGSFVIEAGTWRVIHFRGEGIDIFADFSFEINMGDKWITNYLPVDFIVYQTTSYLGNRVASRYLANIEYKDIRLRQDIKPLHSLNISDFYKLRLDSVPVYNDSAFWITHRPIPLQEKEKDVAREFRLQQQIKQAQQAEKDTSNVMKAQQFAQRMVMDSEYSYKSTRIGYGGLFNPALIGYTSQDGITYRQRVSFNIDLHHNRNIKIKAFAGFMFKRKELFTDLSTTWNYDPFRLGSMTLSLGNGNPTYSSLFIQQIQDSLNEHGFDFKDISVNYFRDYYLKVFNTHEIANGLLFNAGIEYHIRKGASNTAVLRSAKVDSEPIEDLFGTRKAFAPFIRLTWTPEQYYRYEGRQKIYERSRFPTFKVEVSRSFYNIFGSTSEYNRVEVDMSQHIPFGLMNTFQYHIGAGKFTDQKTEYFADFAFFSKSNFPEIWNDRLGGGFNLLNRNLYNVSDSYIQAHLMLETPFLLLKNIPFVSNFADTERLYFSQLYTPQILSYTEFGYGIGNRFFSVAAFGSLHKTQFRQVGVRATFEL
ncbi:MAG TPA: hypothetical protein DDW85_14050 [Porphyromonadaceae bacterium]|nr:hypothetical protein [Porphyromonadaceae bacterium]